MPFSDFAFSDLAEKLAVRVAEADDLHARIPDFPIPQRLAALTETYFPLAVQIGTEKAKSEMIVAPILIEVREAMRQRVSLFSGTEFVIDRDRALNGVCDFLFSRSPVQAYIQSPVAVLVEAKNDSIPAGLGQCGAEMVAARIFNERAKNGIDTIHGCVTTGTLWRFLTLTGDDLTLDRVQYAVPEHLAKVFGILVHAVGGPLA